MNESERDDLLVRLDERTERLDKGYEKLEPRVTDLERIEDRRSGFWAGVRIFPALIVSLPGWVVAIVWGLS